MVVSSVFILPPNVFGRLPIVDKYHSDGLKPQIREHPILTAFTEKQNMPHIYIYIHIRITYLHDILKGPESLFVSTKTQLIENSCIHWWLRSVPFLYWTVALPFIEVHTSSYPFMSHLIIFQHISSYLIISHASKAKATFSGWDESVSQ